MPNELDEKITIRVTSKDRAALKALTSKIPIKQQALARAALRLGMCALDKDPQAFLKATESK